MNDSRPKRAARRRLPMRNLFERAHRCVHLGPAAVPDLFSRRMNG